MGDMSTPGSAEEPGSVDELSTAETVAATSTVADSLPTKADTAAAAEKPATSRAKPAVSKPGKPAPAPKPEKPAAEEAAAAKAPEDPYADLSIEEDSGLAPAELAAVKSYAKKHGLSAEAAKELLDSKQAAHDALFNNFDAQVETWKAELATALGDEDWKSKSAAADAALERFAGPGTKAEGLKELLQDTGFRFYAPLFHFIATVGEALSEPNRIVNGKTHRAGVPLDEDAIWRKNFPNSGDRPSKRASTAHMAS